MSPTVAARASSGSLEMSRPASCTLRGTLPLALDESIAQAAINNTITRSGMLRPRMSRSFGRRIRQHCQMRTRCPVHDRRPRASCRSFVMMAPSAPAIVAGHRCLTRHRGSKGFSVGICDGRVCIITGAGRGIGREHALMLAEHGAKVVVNDIGGEIDGSGRNTGPAHDVVAEVEAAGGEAVANGDDIS